MKLMYPEFLDAYCIDDERRSDICAKACVYEIEPYCDDFVEYLWQKATGKTFNGATYQLEPDGKNWYNKLCEAWIHAGLNEQEIKEDQGFYEFMKSKYMPEALHDFLLCVQCASCIEKGE